MSSGFMPGHSEAITGTLLGNLENMNPDQLKERLVVAETLMRRLYNRNKDIEMYHKQKLDQYDARDKSANNRRAGSAASVDRVQNVVEDDRSDKEVPVKESAAELDEDNEPTDELEMITQFKVREEQLVIEL